MKRLSSILRQMYRMDHYISVTSGDLKKSRGMTFDSTVEQDLFTDRAQMVDERFVERIIQGESIEECMRSTSSHTAPAAPVAVDGSGQPLPNFEDPGAGKPSEVDVDFMREQAGQDF